MFSGELLDGGGESIEVLAYRGGEGRVVEQVGNADCSGPRVDSAQEDRGAQLSFGDVVEVTVGDPFDQSIRAQPW